MQLKTESRSPQLTVLTGRNYSKRTDAELVEMCQKKDNQAFEELVRRHQKTVHGLLYKMAPDWCDTGDLAQEAFIRIWRGIDKVHNPAAFKSWLSQIVTNIFYDELRRRPRRLPTVSLDQSFETEEDQDANNTRDIKDLAPGPDELCQRRELTRVVREAMNALPRQFRVAILLREFDGLSYEEIAIITGSDIGTVKSRISRARSKVQQLLEPYLAIDCPLSTNN